MPDTTGGETPDRCPKCLCEDCGGRLDQHTDGGCTCEDCSYDVQYVCSLAQFKAPAMVGFIAEQLAPLLSVHLGPKQQRRCLAVAHAAHHALRAYDQEHHHG
jgi:hypothetical protein